MIQIQNISKSYGSLKALDNISFDVKPGEIFGLIGADGAGKTSLFRILTTLMLPDSGSANIDSLDIVKEYKNIRANIGYMPGKFSLYQDLSIEENLNFFASIFNMRIEDAYHLIKPIYKQIEPFKTRKAGKLSGGMKQKLALCCALIHKPKILLLDEPTTGVDVVSRAEFWDMLDTLKQQGIAILVSTPYMDEASRCDRIALIYEGKILSINTPEKMVTEYPHELYSLSGENIYALLLHSRKHNDVISAYSFGNECHIAVNQNFDIEDYKVFLNEKGFSNFDFKKTSATVEDIFIDLMK